MYKQINFFTIIYKKTKKFFHNINYTMKGELLILFVILLLGLILCSFLGGKACIEGMENDPSSKVYYGPNGSSGTVQTDSTGKKSLVITKSDGTTVTYTLKDGSSSSFNGPNGGTANIVTNSDGSSSLVVTLPNGTVYTYNPSHRDSDHSNAHRYYHSHSYSTNYDNYNHYDGTSYPTIFYGPNGGTARVIKTANNNTLVITNKNGTTEIYYINNQQSNPNITSYYGPNGGSAKIVSGNDGKQAVEITGPNGNKIVYTVDNNHNNYQDETINQYSADNITTGSDYNTAYSNSLPQGIRKSLIPPGQEDLYILKSQVVPPVCPKCPDPIVQCPENNDVTKCPPCPACERCAEPSFTCKKVPNYSAFNQDYMPVPVLNDFSTFGM